MGYRHGPEEPLEQITVVPGRTTIVVLPRAAAVSCF